MPIAICLFYFNRLDFSFRLLLFFWLVGFVVDAVCRVLANNQINNIVFINTYRLFEWICVIYVFKMWKEPILQKFSYITLFLVVIINWISVILLKPISDNETIIGNSFAIIDSISVFNTWVCILESLMLIFFASSLLLQFSKSGDFLIRNSKFWIVLGFFLYFTINLAVYATAEIKLKTDNGLVVLFAEKSWAMHNAISVIANVVTCIGLVLLPTKLNSTQY